MKQWTPTWEIFQHVDVGTRIHDVDPTKKKLSHVWVDNMNSVFQHGNKALHIEILDFSYDVFDKSVQ